MDTKFSAALHVLVMISESEDVLSSQVVANSVGTNASFIRKILGLLKKANIIESRQGKVGYTLSRHPKEISLLEIYLATQEVQDVSIFPIHQNVNRECPVGHYIEEAMKPIFSNVEELLKEALSTKKLDDVIENLYRVANIPRK